MLSAQEYQHLAAFRLPAATATRLGFEDSVEDKDDAKVINAKAILDDAGAFLDTVGEKISEMDLNAQDAYTLDQDGGNTPKECFDGVKQLSQKVTRVLREDFMESTGLSAHYFPSLIASACTIEETLERIEEHFRYTEPEDGSEEDLEARERNGPYRLVKREDCQDYAKWMVITADDIFQRDQFVKLTTRNRATVNDIKRLVDRMTAVMTKLGQTRNDLEGVKYFLDIDLNFIEKPPTKMFEAIVKKHKCDKENVESFLNNKIDKLAAEYDTLLLELASPEMNERKRMTRWIHRLLRSVPRPKLSIKTYDFDADMWQSAWKQAERPLDVNNNNGNKRQKF